MTPRMVVCLLLAGGLAVPAAGQAPRQPETPAQRAGKTYTSAMSALNTRQYDQAQVLLEKYVRSFPTHEYVPVGYMQLAYCRQALKNGEGCEEALDEVIERFRGSPAWHNAYASKLGRALAGKDHERYVELLEKMVSGSPELPLDLAGGMGWHYGNYHSYSYHGRYFQPTAGRMGSIQRRPGWVLNLLKAADTPERAEKILAALAATLRRRAEELPTDWQFAHVQLLKKAGKADQADELLRRYLDSWREPPGGGQGAKGLQADPRGIDLYLLWIRDAQAAKDTQTVEAAWKELIETYFGAGALGDPLYGRLAALSRSKGRWEEFTALARRFLTTYATHRYWGSVISLWMGAAKAKAAKGDPSLVPSALEVVKELYEPRHPGPVPAGLLWRIDLNLVQGQVEAAAKLARELLARPAWSAGTFQLLASYAAAHKPFREVLDAAREQYRIPVANPTSKAFVLLNQLKIRLKDDQVRHAEEIGEEMFGKHPDDASTTEGVKLLADYYFKKVLAEPRDKWMERMIRTYPFHPLTQAVLANKVTSTGAARLYKEQAGAVDRMTERFPRVSPSYYGRRLRLYDIAHDSAGKLEFVKRVKSPAAAAGDVSAIAELARYELAGMEKYKEIGDAWVAKAKPFGTSAAGLYCLYRAWSAYYYTPWRHGRRDEVAWAEGLAVMKQLRDQPLYPEWTWRLAFGEVNMLAHQHKAQAMLAALKARLGKRPRWRDVSLRLDLSAVGWALGAEKMTEQGKALARQLRGLCFTRRDAGAIELMLAAMHGAQKDYEAAATHYMNIVNASPFPARMYPYFSSAAGSLRQAGSKRYPNLVEAYMRKIGRTQELVPGLLYQLGVYYFSTRGPAAVAARNRLAARYPCSIARDNLEKIFARLRPRPRPRRPKPKPRRR